MGKIVQGKDLMVFTGTSENDAKSIAFATAHTLSISAETSDISTKDRASGMFAESEVTALSWEASTENLYAAKAADADGSTFEDLFDKMTAGTKITLVFGLKTDATEVPSAGWSPDKTTAGYSYYKGEGYVTSLSLNANNGEKASYSATFTGTGALTKVTNS